MNKKIVEHPVQKKQSTAGGAAVEYIIVTTFATLLAIAGVAFVSKTIKAKIEKLEDKLGVRFDQPSLDLF